MKVAFTVHLGLSKTNGPTIDATELPALIADALDADLPADLYVQADDADEETGYSVTDISIVPVAS